MPAVREVAAGKLDVLARDVVEIGMAGQPSELGVVLAHDAGIGRRALTDVERTVRPDCRAVGVMVSHAWQTFHYGLCCTGVPS